MPITILPREKSLGGLLGSTLGAGIGQRQQSKELLAKEERQREFLREQLKEKLAAEERRQQEKERKSALFSQLLSGQPLNQLGLSAPNQEIGAASLAQGVQQPGQPLTREQALQAAALEGLSPQEISQLERSFSSRDKQAQQQSQFEQKQEQQQRQFEGKQDIGRERLRLQEEAPERKLVVEEVNKKIKSGRRADDTIKKYKELIELSKSPNFRSGSLKQIATKFGVPDLFQSSVSDVFEKVSGQIASDSLLDLTTPGKVASGLLSEIKKQNPSSIQNPEASRLLSKMGINSKKAEKIIGTELSSLLKKNRGKRYDLDIIDKALHKVSPRLEKIHKKELDLVNQLARVAGVSTDENTFESRQQARQQQRQRAAPQKTRLGPQIQRQRPRSSNVLEPASQDNIGVIATDSVTGERLESNGIEWVPAKRVR